MDLSFRIAALWTLIILNGIFLCNQDYLATKSECIRVEKKTNERRMKNKEIQTKRIMSYFIDATAKIIEEEGIEHVTIRKVADAAGYNSATIYNYFEDLSHLILFASLKFLKKYTDALPQYLSKAKTPLDRYFLIWECFCKHSFESPHIFYAVFSSDLGVHPNDLADYYDVYPADILSIPEDLKDMFLEPNITKRTGIALKKAVADSQLHNVEVEQIAETHYLIWQGMLTLFINNRSTYSVQEATDRTMEHIKRTMIHLDAEKPRVT